MLAGNVYGEQVEAESPARIVLLRNSPCYELRVAVLGVLIGAIRPAAQ